ncbi:MAG: glycosyltransferase family 2 protein [Bacillota bacterium]
MEGVSVIIPTHNREHTLKVVIDSYFSQSCVREIIFVLDGCTDGTLKFLKSIQGKGKKADEKMNTYNGVDPDKCISQKEVTRREKWKTRDHCKILDEYESSANSINIKILENPKRKGLPFSRNRGVKASVFPYVFMGEDDVILGKDCIKEMIGIMRTEEADITGGRVFYMSDNESYKDTFVRYRQKEKDLSGLDEFGIRLNYPPAKFTEVPYLQAVALMKKEIFTEVSYDTHYRGSSYREETDFYLKCRKAGRKILLLNDQICYNLSPKYCKGSGQRGINPAIYEFSAITNNLRFLIKHYSFLRSEYNIEKSVISLQYDFIKRRFNERIKKSIISLLKFKK